MHRTSEIRTNWEIKNWCFISGALNISGQCIRPLSFEDLSEENSYLVIPKFLSEPLQNILLKDDNVVQDNDTTQDSVVTTSNPISIHK